VAVLVVRRYRASVPAAAGSLPPAGLSRLPT
jgi:hypothetical protein